MSPGFFRIPSLESCDMPWASSVFHFLTCPPHSSPFDTSNFQPSCNSPMETPCPCSNNQGSPFQWFCSGFVLEQLHPCSLCGTASNFLTYKISYLLFLNLDHQTKMKTAKGERILIATHTDQSNILANQQQVLGFAMHFASLRILSKNAGPKPFC